MFIFSILVEFVAFPSRKDAIFYNNGIESVDVEASGSIGVYKNGKCEKTHPNQTLGSDENRDWCSNIATSKTENPWVQYSLNGKQMKLKGFSVRNGCCRYTCCCEEENGKIVDKYCCCILYSYSLLGSNDNKTWKVIHKVVKDKTFYYCESRTFDFEKVTEPFRYFRFVLDEEWPGCLKCMQINQIEFYGETMNSGYVLEADASEDDESISIIGRVNRDE